MWTADFSTAIPASREAVWAVLSDVAGWPQWNEGAESIELLGPVAVGTRFVMTPPGEDSISSEIVELREGEAISDLTDFQGIQIVVRHLLSAKSADSTTVTYKVEVSGDAPHETLQDVGGMVSSDFPDVLTGLSARVTGQA